MLDIGAGWGQTALPLSRAHEVAALEPTPERLAFIRAAAVQEGVTKRLHFIQADFFDVEFETKFDLVTCIGVLEWVPKFRPGDPRKCRSISCGALAHCWRPIGGWSWASRIGSASNTCWELLMTTLASRALPFMMQNSLPRKGSPNVANRSELHLHPR